MSSDEPNSVPAVVRTLWFGYDRQDHFAAALGLPSPSAISKAERSGQFSGPLLKLIREKALGDLKHRLPGDFEEWMLFRLPTEDERKRLGRTSSAVAS